MKVSRGSFIDTRCGFRGLQGVCQIAKMLTHVSVDVYAIGDFNSEASQFSFMRIDRPIKMHESEANLRLPHGRLSEVIIRTLYIIMACGLLVNQH